LDNLDPIHIRPCDQGRIHAQLSQLGANPYWAVALLTAPTNQRFREPPIAQQVLLSELLDQIADDIDRVAFGEQTSA
jgi:hypothetical protein